MQRIKFTSSGCNATLGNFGSGDTANVSDALARHLIDDAKCAVLLEPAQARAADTGPTAAEIAALTVPELKAKLDAAGIAYDAGAKKADLQALLAGS